MFFLKQSTASQSVLIGPFIDDTDGKTAETGLTIANTDIRISKNGANIVAKNSGGGTHDELGYYSITLDATDTNTVGRLQVMADVTGALPVYHEFQVLEEATYDFWYASGATPLADINAEVVDVLNTDTYSEPGQGAPTATPTIRQMVHYLYKSWRNKKDNDGTETNFYADDGTTVDHKQSTTASGDTVTKGEIATGP